MVIAFTNITVGSSTLGLICRMNVEECTISTQKAEFAQANV